MSSYLPMMQFFFSWTLLANIKVSGLSKEISPTRHQDTKKHAGIIVTVVLSVLQYCWILKHVHFRITHALVLAAELDLHKVLYALYGLQVIFSQETWIYAYTILSIFNFKYYLVQNCFINHINTFKKCFCIVFFTVFLKCSPLLTYAVVTAF